jgi:hypothetical protein
MVACGRTPPTMLWGDGLFPDTQDIEDFISVFGGVPCSTGMCHDIDFNNDGLFPDVCDLHDMISIFAGRTGPCPSCNW